MKLSARRIVLFALALVVLIPGAFLVTSFLSSRTALDYPRSDHFDGRRFINPTLAEQISPGLSDIFGMIRETRAEWPRNLENTGAPQLDADLGQNGMALTFVGHATFLIQLPGMNILTDPVWSDRASPVSWAGPRRVRPPGVGFDALPDIDVVLISHNHYDHLDLATLRRLNERFAPTFLVPLGNRSLLESIGISSVHEMDWWDGFEAASATIIVFTPSQHSSGRGLFDRGRSLWGSFFIQRGGRSVFFGGDGGYSTQFAEIRERLGPPEIALLGIGSYEPRWFMRPLHKNPAEAVQAHLDLGARLSIGMHIGTFQLATEGYEQPHAELAAALEREGVAADRFITPPEGETRLVATPSE